jgi:hypothetical protein
MTGRDAVAGAMKELGVIAAGADPSASELTDGLDCLNQMLKSWGAMGVTPWRNTDGTASITGGVASVALSPRPIDVLEVRAVISSADVPLRRWGHGEYNMIRSKATAGDPTLYALMETPSTVTLYVYPVPASTTSIKYSYARIINDVDDPSDVVDVPQQWYETVKICLAARLPTMFGTTRVDPAAVEHIQKRAEQLQANMLEHDRPASYKVGQAS